MLTSLLNDRIIENVQYLIPNEQFGFQGGKSTVYPLQTLIATANYKLQQHRGKLYAADIDFTKAFDTGDRSRLVAKLSEQFGISGRLHSLIRDFLKGNVVHI